MELFVRIIMRLSVGVFMGFRLSVLECDGAITLNLIGVNNMNF